MQRRTPQDFDNRMLKALRIYQPPPDGTDEPSILQDLEMYYAIPEDQRDWLPGVLSNDDMLLDIPSGRLLERFHRSTPQSDLFEPLIARTAQGLWRVYRSSSLNLRLTTLGMALGRLYCLYDQMFIQTCGLLWPALLMLVITSPPSVLWWAVFVAIGVSVHRCYRFYRVCSRPTLNNDAIEERIRYRDQRFSLEPHEPESIWYMVFLPYKNVHLETLLYINELWAAGRLSGWQLYALRFCVSMQVLMLRMQIFAAMSLWMFSAAYVAVVVVFFSVCPFLGHPCYSALWFPLVVGTIGAATLGIKLRAELDMIRRRFVRIQTRLGQPTDCVL